MERFFLFVMTSFIKLKGFIWLCVMCVVSLLPRLDGSMPEGVEISNSTLAFARPLEIADSGVYRCEVTNDIGVSSQNVNLWVYGTFRPLHSVSSNVKKYRFACFLISNHLPSIWAF